MDMKLINFESGNIRIIPFGMQDKSILKMSLIPCRLKGGNTKFSCFFLLTGRFEISNP